MIQTTHAFGAAVRAARQRRGWSQADLADAAGVSRPWLSELENGKRTVELGRVLLVLAALDLGIEFVDADRSGEIDLDALLGDPHS